MMIRSRPCVSSWKRKDAATFPPVSYTISSYSSYASCYKPEGILVDRPYDQLSRWCAGSGDSPFITLKVDSPCVLHGITFGKFHKVHICNMKEFKVFVSFRGSPWIPVLHSHIRNDEEPETFALQHLDAKDTANMLPCTHVKIVPLSAWGPNFNPSIWYVMLRGEAAPDVVSLVIQEFEKKQHVQATKLCLKYLRLNSYSDAFDALARDTNVELEDPLLTNLFHALMVEGNFGRVEELLQTAADQGHFDPFVAAQKYTALWKRILHPGRKCPGMRGGHQMSIDVDGRAIYMLGGWDGKRDLADFWKYDIVKDEWILLSENTTFVGGPSPRSCHKMCMDSKRRCLYTLGRYVDPEYRDVQHVNGDFFVYWCDTNQWQVISQNTEEDGGPELVYDHQMAVDTDHDVLWVYGGRTIQHQASSALCYSGLYKYDLLQKKWTNMESESFSKILRSRIGHSMLIHPKDNSLLIFAGQRNKDYLADFYSYDIETNKVYELSRDCSREGGPDAGFTQRSTLDADLDEMYVFSGLMRDKFSAQDTVRNTLWVYDICNDSWQRVYANYNDDAAYWARMSMVEPCPRFAHQFVYDKQARTHYLFGGNPGESSPPDERLDDFWSLELVRSSTRDIARKAIFEVRKLQYLEMCREPSHVMDALQYLQTSVSACVDQSSGVEVTEFEGLSRALVGAQDPEFRPDRMALFETLIQYFPPEMKEPTSSIQDFV
ncbi:muskelin [Andalucia godoyi]|uniref:Muskelin n=1 Tax=Andalucia godoyi TaxID=505711 RepID=A0A8K0AGW3_ANDGO|nr:muskelin [Andalucia godoyi]|eukprot:ANDGO_01505.mRNA.1 muskelin